MHANPLHKGLGAQKVSKHFKQVASLSGTPKNIGSVCQQPPSRFAGACNAKSPDVE